MLIHKSRWCIDEKYLHPNAKVFPLTLDNLKHISAFHPVERAFVILIEQEDGYQVEYDQVSAFSFGVGGLLTKKEHSRDIRTKLAMILWLHDCLTDSCYKKTNQVHLLLCEKYLKQSIALSDIDLSLSVINTLIQHPTVKRKKLIEQRLNKFTRDPKQHSFKFNVRSLLNELTAHVFVHHRPIDVITEKNKNTYKP